MLLILEDMTECESFHPASRMNLHSQPWPSPANAVGRSRPIW